MRPVSSFVVCTFIARPSRTAIVMVCSPAGICDASSATRLFRSCSRHCVSTIGWQWQTRAGWVVDELVVGVAIRQAGQQLNGLIFGIRVVVRSWVLSCE